MALQAGGEWQKDGRESSRDVAGFVRMIRYRSGRMHDTLKNLQKRMRNTK